MGLFSRSSSSATNITEVDSSTHAADDGSIVASGNVNVLDAGAVQGAFELSRTFIEEAGNITDKMQDAFGAYAGQQQETTERAVAAAVSQAENATSTFSNDILKPLTPLLWGVAVLGGLFIWRSSN